MSLQFVVFFISRWMRIPRDLNGCDEEMNQWGPISRDYTDVDRAVWVGLAVEKYKCGGLLVQSTKAVCCLKSQTVIFNLAL